MADRKKVLKGLAFHLKELTIGETCFDCPYCGDNPCEIQLIADTIALLKEQEHSETFAVIDNKTGEEADTYEIALHEDWAKHLCYCDMEGWAIEEDGTLLLVDECGQLAYADRERFKVKWE